MTQSVISESSGRCLFKFSNNSVVPHSQQVHHVFHDKQSLAQIVKHFKYVQPNITFNTVLKFTSQKFPKQRMEKTTKDSVSGYDNGARQSDVYGTPHCKHYETASCFGVWHNTRHGQSSWNKDNV